MYEKCAHCHLFIEPNHEALADSTLAAYLHLHRGDDADTALDESHEAKPSGETHTIEWWEANGPQAMRERFRCP